LRIDHAALAGALVAAALAGRFAQLRHPEQLAAQRPVATAGLDGFPSLSARSSTCGRLERAGLFICGLHILRRLCVVLLVIAFEHAPGAHPAVGGVAFARRGQGCFFWNPPHGPKKEASGRFTLGKRTRKLASRASEMGQQETPALQKQTPGETLRLSRLGRSASSEAAI